MKNLIKLSVKNEFSWTINRAVYNKIHKDKNASCSYCRWNRGCNTKNHKYFGYSTQESGYKKVRIIKYPSWKLATKNKKQWMAKPKSYKIKEKISTYTGRAFVEIKFAKVIF